MILFAPPGRTGSASGMVSVARLLGQTVGGMLVALTLGFITHGATSACLIFASFSACLAASFSGLRKRG
jgi:DHA2 family multidrug resistance protein-like MFS transporter